VGAFVIEDEFDDRLRAYYGELEEKVFVLQQFAPHCLRSPLAAGRPVIPNDAANTPIAELRVEQSTDNRIN
jgi:hypothetical protein